MESLKATDQLLNEAVERLQRLDQTLVERVGASSAPNLDRILRLLRQMQSKTGHYLESRGYGFGAGRFRSRGVHRRMLTVQWPLLNSCPGRFSSHQDVHKALEMIITFYEQNEPSQPGAVASQTGQTTCGVKVFVDIIRDISPGAIPQVQAVSGENESGE